MSESRVPFSDQESYRPNGTITGLLTLLGVGFAAYGEATGKYTLKDDALMVGVMAAMGAGWQPASTALGNTFQYIGDRRQPRQ